MKEIAVTAKRVMEVLKKSFRFHFIDLLVLSIGIFAVAGFYIFFKRTVDFIPIRLKITDENALYAESSPGNEYALAFKEGDEERDELGQVVSKIIEVDSYATGDKSRVVYVTVLVKAVYNPRKGVYTLNGKKIVFGQSIILNFSKVFVKGLVVDFPGYMDDLNVEKKTIKVKAKIRDESRSFSDTYGIPDYYFKPLKVGDSIFLDKETGVKITQISAKPADRVVVSGYRAVSIKDPVLFDVTIDLEMNVKKIKGVYYIFDFIPIKVGSVIPLSFPEVNIYPTITEIESEN